MVKKAGLQSRLKFFWALILFAAGLLIGVAAALSFVRVEDTITAKGEVGAEEKFDLTSPVDGKVTELLHKEGENVKAGEAVLVFDDSKLRDEMQATESSINELEGEIKVKRDELGILGKDPLPKEYRHAEITLKECEETLAKATEKLARFRKLHEQKAVSTTEFDKIQLEHVQQKAALERAREIHAKVVEGLGQRIIDKTASELALLETKSEGKRKSLTLLERHLADYTILAPLDGKIVELPCKTKMYAEKGEVVARLAVVDRKKIVAHVDERDIGKIRLGQPARIASGVYSRLQYWYFVCDVIKIPDLPDKETGNVPRYSVEILISDEQQDLKLGSSAEVVIVTGRDIALRVLLGLTAESHRLGVGHPPDKQDHAAPAADAMERVGK